MATLELINIFFLWTVYCLSYCLRLLLSKQFTAFTTRSHFTLAEAQTTARGSKKTRFDGIETVLKTLVTKKPGGVQNMKYNYTPLS